LDLHPSRLDFHFCHQAGNHLFHFHTAAVQQSNVGSNPVVMLLLTPGVMFMARVPNAKPHLTPVATYTSGYRWCLDWLLDLLDSFIYSP
jgi:hypothetical protein